MFENYNPENGLLLASYECSKESYVLSKINLSYSASNDLKNISINDRSAALKKLSSSIRKKQDYFAMLITITMGKPITHARLEVEKCCDAMDHYANYAPDFLKLECKASSYHKSWQLLQPLGVVFTVMPWNYPLWQVIRVLAPNFMLGNSLVLAHAPNVYAVGSALQSIIDTSDFPKGMLTNILPDYNFYRAIIQHDNISGLAFTGSDRVGGMLASYAAEALKPTTLECGGSDPYIVLEDADIVNAAKVIAKMRFNNSGQVCISAKRVIVLDKVYDDFIDLIKLETKKYQYGSPQIKDTIMGPIARADIRENVHNQVLDAKQRGAICLAGGEIPDTQGYYYPASVLIDVNDDMRVFKEEVFGPVLSIIKVKDEKEALKLSNNHVYGLGAAVFTRDQEKGLEFAKNIKCGTCAINSGISSDFSLPFGGVGRSGFGRELGLEGLKAFANIKSIVSS